MHQLTRILINLERYNIMLYCFMCILCSTFYNLNKIYNITILKCIENINHLFITIKMSNDPKTSKNLRLVKC